MNKIVILEFIDEYKDFSAYIKQNNLNQNNFKIVALECKLQAYLRKENIDFETTVPYFDSNSHKKIIVETEKIMEHIATTFNFTDSIGIKNFYLTEPQHYIRLMLNHIYKMIEIVNNIYIKNGDVEFYVSVSNGFSSDSIFIQNNDRCIGILTERFARNNNIKCINFISRNTPVPHTLQTNLTDKGMTIIDSLVLNIARFCIKVFGKKLILIHGNGYGFRKLKRDLFKKDFNGINFISFYNDVLKLKWFHKLGLIFYGIFTKHFWVDLNAVYSEKSESENIKLSEAIDSIFNKDEKKIFQYQQLFYGDLVESKKPALKNYLVKMLNQAYKLNLFAKDFNIKLIMSPLSRGIWYVAGELSRKIGIKSLLVSHGTHPVPIDDVHEIELLNLCRGMMLSDYTDIALSTPVQERHLHYFKSKYNWVKNNEVKTGPLIFAEVKERNKFREKFGFLDNDAVIVHATSTKGRQAERYYFLEILDEYFSGLSDIINCINKIDNTRLVIRLHPGFFLSDDEMKKLLPVSEKYIINRMGEFENILSMSDLLISYSSTCIDEALINKIPVILYDKWNRYNHFKTGVYENNISPDILPVCYVNDNNNLESAVRFVINRFTEIKNEKINFSKYRYEENYKENFYKFVKGVLS